MDPQWIVSRFNQGWSMDELCRVCLGHLKEARKELKKNAKRGGAAENARRQRGPHNNV